jgi:long-chain fatty acid transport protein
VSNHGNDELYFDGIFRCADEAFNLQILFDPFEEQLNLPMLLIKVCYRARTTFQIVCIANLDLSSILTLSSSIRRDSSMKRIIILMAMLFAGLQAAQAGGFMVGEMSTRSAGMASAFTAVSDDASAAWHNPAGVAFTEGSQLMAGGDILISSNDFATNTSNPLHPASADTGTNSFLIPHAYFTYMDQESGLGASLSINSPFGLETDWPITAPFSSKNTFSRINMVMVNPSVIFKVSDQLSIAAGADYAYVNKVDLNNTVQRLNGDGDGWGGNVSIFYKGDSFNFGVTYRSKIKVDIKGVASAVAGGALARFGATSSSALTGITLPDQVNVGLGWMPNKEWTVSVDVDWVNWKTYDSIDIAYASAAYRAVLSGVQGFLGVPVTGRTHLPQNWKATVAFRLGAEWKYNSRMRARFGYVFDPTPIEDIDFSPSVPGNDRHLFSIGYGYDVNPDTTIDLGYAYVYFNKRNQTQSPAAPLRAPNSVKNGIYKGSAHIIMSSLSYRF